ncbi:hypothetical protein ACPA9J_32925 [Pseudomonas aeruginosa]
MIPQPRNRVALKININEGTVAAISHINVVGNTVFRRRPDRPVRTEDHQLAVVLKNDDKYAPRKALRRPQSASALLPGPRRHQHGYRLHQVSITRTSRARLHRRQHQRGEEYTIREREADRRPEGAGRGSEAPAAGTKGQVFSARKVMTTTSG